MLSTSSKRILANSIKPFSLKPKGMPYYQTKYWSEMREAKARKVARRIARVQIRKEDRALALLKGKPVKYRVA